MVVHRDVGYLLAALTVVYAISGIAVNHLHHWNPSYKIERVEQRFEPIPVGERESMIALAVERLELPGPPQEKFRPSPEVLQLFYDGWSVEVLATEGRAVIERPRDRPLLRDFNYLHLNQPKGVWTYVADVYAGLLLLLAVSGMLMLKGKRGLAGRGKWFVLAGPCATVGVRDRAALPGLSSSFRFFFFFLVVAGTCRRCRGGKVESSSSSSTGCGVLPRAFARHGGLARCGDVDGLREWVGHREPDAYATAPAVRSAANPDRHRGTPATPGGTPR